MTPNNDGYLLIFGIGPVQSFIAQARRTQDLWVGSRLLHLISLAALQDTVLSYNATAIYPVVDAAGKLKSPRLSMPNRFIVYLPTGDYRTVAESAQEAAHRKWLELAAAVHNDFQSRFKLPGGDRYRWDTLWSQQCGTDPKEPPTWLEFYWAAAPLNGDYPAAFDRASRLFAARKQCRNFVQVPAQDGDKCTLNGALSALSDSSKRDDIRAFWRGITAKANAKGSRATLKPGERLCAVSVVKRFAQDVPAYQEEEAFGRQRFPSTSTIAAAPYKIAVAEQWDRNPALVTAFQSYADALTRLGLDPIDTLGYPALEQAARSTSERLQDFLFYDGDYSRAEGLTDSALCDQLGIEKTEAARYKPDFEAIRSAFAKFDKLAHEATKARPHTYYAVIMLDGDSMGEYLSQLDAEGHTQFSSTLSAFASTHVGNIVEDGDSEYLPEAVTPGRLIYSGGDDVLAMVPARSALVIADALRRAFTTTLAEAGFADVHASAGIAIAHYTQPLEIVLNAARAAEKEAKTLPGKNAVAVSLIRRSGETRTAVAKWAYAEQLTVPLLQQVMTAFAARDQLSSKLAYDTLEIAAVMDVENLNINGLPGGLSYRAFMADARRAEFIRIFKRRSMDGRGSASVTFAPTLATLAESITESLRDAGRVEDSGWQSLAHWLMIARFLTRGE